MPTAKALTKKAFTQKRKSVLKKSDARITKLTFVPAENELRIVGNHIGAADKKRHTFMAEIDGNMLFSSLYQFRLLHNTNYFRNENPRWRFSDPCPTGELITVVCDYVDQEDGSINFAFDIRKKDGSHFPETITTEDMSVNTFVNLLADDGFLEYVE